MSQIHFPHGHMLGPVPLLVVLKSDAEIPLMAKFFPVPGAMFVGYGAQIGGRSFRAVVVAGVSVTSLETPRIHTWLNEVVRTRLTPDAAGVMWL